MTMTSYNRNPFLRDPAETKRINKIIWQNSSWRERVRILLAGAFISMLMGFAMVLGVTDSLLVRLGFRRPVSEPPAALAAQLLTPEKIDAYRAKQKRR